MELSSQARLFKAESVVVDLFWSICRTMHLFLRQQE